MTWTHRVTGGPWPERIGLRCRIVPPPEADVYPWHGRHPREVIVLIEDDHFADGRSRLEVTDVPRENTDVWSCALNRRDITELPS